MFYKCLLRVEEHGSTACVESRAGMYVRFPGYATTAVEQRQLEREAGRPSALRHPPTPPRRNHLLRLLFIPPTPPTSPTSPTPPTPSRKNHLLRLLFLLFSSLHLQSFTSLIFLCTAIVLSIFATFFFLNTFSVWCHSLDCARSMFPMHVII